MRTTINLNAIKMQKEKGDSLSMANADIQDLSIPIISLKSIDTTEKITDYDSEILFKRIYTPENKKSEKLQIFCKNPIVNPNNEYSTKNVYMVSDRYVAVRTEDVVNYIFKKLSANEEHITMKQNKPIYINESFIQIPIDFVDLEFAKTESAKETANLMRVLSILSDDIPQHQNIMSMTISNGYNGLRKLELNYSLKILCDNRPMVTNYFLAQDVSFQSIHSRFINLTPEKIMEVHNKMENHISEYKSTKLTSLQVQSLTPKYLSEKQFKLFLKSFDALEDDCKNLYYATVILSKNIGDDVLKYSVLHKWVEQILQKKA